MNPLRKDTQLTYEDALARLPDLLKVEGFGILTKIGAEFRKYRILGACNPQLAHKVLSTELGVGVMLPCNVVVYEGDDGKAVVLAIDPMQTMASADERIEPVAREVRDRLSRVLQQV